LTCEGVISCISSDFCDGDSTCIADLAACTEDDYTCIATAICDADSTCIADVEAYGNDDDDDTDDTDDSGTGRRKLKKLRASLVSYDYTSAVVLKGRSEVGGSFSTFCWHYHLYDFAYTSVTT
jgi:hypothetical protein